MNKKRKNEIEKYWLKINKMHRDLKFMKYDHNLGMDSELKNAVEIIEEIKNKLTSMLDKG
jgi:hypothetical protein